MLFRPRSHLILLNDIYKDLAYKTRTDHYDINLLASVRPYQNTNSLSFWRIKKTESKSVYI